MIFPEFRGKNGGYINLDECARQHPLAKGFIGYPKKSPFLDPHVCKEMVESAHDVLGLDYSYGGWFEDRSHVWRGSYLDAGLKFVHLGYDFNAPVGTRVSVSRECEVIQIDDDTPEIGGWGTRLIVRLIDINMFLIYAHTRLTLSHSEKKPGAILHPGHVFGQITTSDKNGYWYPHVHVQAMTIEAYRLFEKDPASLDGYGKQSEIAMLARLYPDPLRFIDID